jgi:putative membrane protein
MEGFKSCICSWYPSFQPGSHIFVIKGSILPKVILKILFFGAYSTVITYISLYVQDISIEKALIAVVGGFIALLLAFRANTAYDRFWEGSKLWCELQTQLRKIGLVIWSTDEASNEVELSEKKKIMQLLVAYAVSIKHYLRFERGPDYPDLKHLLKCMNKYSNLEDEVCEPEKKKCKFSILKSEKEEDLDFTIPMEISHHLISYLSYKLEKNKLLGNGFDRLRVYMDDMMATVTAMERILATPLPLAYSVHLSQSVWIFLIILPYQMLSMVPTDPWSVPVFMSLSSFILFGILSLSEEIGNSSFSLFFYLY